MSPIAFLTIAGIVPFSISAIVVVFGSLFVAEYAMAFGFGFMIVGATLVALRDLASTALGLEAQKLKGLKWLLKRHKQTHYQTHLDKWRLDYTFCLPSKGFLVPKLIHGEGRVFIIPMADRYLQFIHVSACSADTIPYLVATTPTQQVLSTRIVLKKLVHYGNSISSIL